MTLMVAARNISDTTAFLQGSIRYTRSDGRTGVIALGKVRLGPGEVKAWEPKEAGLLRRADVVSAGLELDYSTGPGSVVVSALSVSRSGNQVFQIPMLDPKAQTSSTGVYPFYLDYGYSTVVYIKNSTAVEQKYITHLNYEGGEYMIGVRNIGPGETASIDVRALRDNQVADEAGRTIPLDVMRGQARWAIILEEGTDLLAMIGRSELVNEAGGISSTYACQNCCGDHAESDFITPSLTQLEVGGSAILRAFERRIDCYGFPYDVQRSASWSSDNQSVATVVKVSSGGQVTSVGAGQTTIRANWNSSATIPQQCSGPLGPIPNPPEPIPCCLMDIHFGSAGAAVQVAASPDHLVVVEEQQGSTTQLPTGGTCPNPYFLRQVRFRVVSSDANGALPVGNVVVEERFNSVTTNTCGNGQPQAAPCTTTINNGTFIDSISTGCGSAAGQANCGYDISWKWYWCGNGTQGIQILASLTAQVRKESVTLNGRSTEWPTGTAFRP